MTTYVTRILFAISSERPLNPGERADCGDILERGLHPIKLIIPKAIAPHFDILGIVLAGKELLSDVIPAQFFIETAFGIGFEWPFLTEGSTVFIKVRCTSKAPQYPTWWPHVLMRFPFRWLCRPRPVRFRATLYGDPS